MRFFFLLLLAITAIRLQSQSVFLPSNSSDHQLIERFQVKSGRLSSQIHSSLRPFERKASVSFLEEIDTTLNRLTAVDRHLINSFLNSNPEWAASPSDSSRRPILKRFYAYPNDLFRYHSDQFFLSVNPVLELSAEIERGVDSPHFLNTRGVEVRGLINQRVGFYTFLTTTQGRFPDFVMRQQNAHSGAFPGEGWTKGFGDGGVDFFTARGYIAFNATENIGFQFGQDRNFAGHGIRSLLLSDYANNYLFLKINTRYRWFHYQNLFAHLIDFPLRTFGGNRYDPKYAVAHQVAFRISPRLQIGFFESVVFGVSDTLNARGFEWYYLNPVIFYRALEHKVGDPDRVTVGMNWEWMVTPGLGVYGQFVADEFYIADIRADIDSMLVRLGLRRERKFQTFASMRNQFGLQVGLKLSDPFGIQNLDLQGEINLIRPYLYQHYDLLGNGRRPSASHSHYSQPLAHPLGANLAEWLIKGSYRPMKNLEFAFTVLSYTQGTDVGGVNYGGNVMRDYREGHGMYNNFFLQGRQISVLLGELSASFQFMPGWFFDLRFRGRTQTESETGLRQHENMIMGAGLRVNTAPRRHLF